MTTKERILTLLEANRGKCISGAEIAAELQLSRNAVWKAVTALRAEGYPISAGTNKGYCLAAESDILSIQGILPLLNAQCRRYAEYFRFFPATESTNRTAKELALAGAPHGTVILAECQTQGRGRYARKFFSPPGGLYLSIILHPEQLRFEQITAVTAFAAVAVCEAIASVSGQNADIKWVNDILIGRKKVCGILTEAVTDFESGSLSWIVLGIGINVHTRPEDFPPELQKTACSVFGGQPAAGARSKLTAEILNRILGFETPPPEAEIYTAYRARLMMLDETVTVIQGAHSYPAKALDIDRAGHLIVQTASGEQQTLSSGEIRIQLS